MFGTDGRLRLNNSAFAAIWKLSPQQLSELPRIDELIRFTHVLYGEMSTWTEISRAVTSFDQREPLVYRQGQGELFPALEAALAGAKEGESRPVKLPPVEAYGERNPDLVIEVETERVPEEARKPGALLSTRDANDEPRVVRVQEVRGDRVVIDLNHPLAGETLVFDVKILDVQ